MSQANAIRLCLADIVAGNDPDIEAITALEPDVMYWICNLTQDEARDAQRFPPAAVLMHVRGRTTLPIKPRPDARQRAEIGRQVEEVTRFQAETMVDEDEEGVAYSPR